MGFFSKLFGKGEELPQLDASSPAKKMLEKHKGELEPFVTKMHDRLEFLPTDGVVYCFIGKPPAMFGMAWFSEGVEHNMKTMAAAKGLSPKKLQHLSMKLGEVYQKFMADPKYMTEIAGKQVIVTPAEAFVKEVADVLHPVE
ncbi:MAG: hypothetical protein OEW15_07965 [Nitrospirota bacterium]|nr:hypothetical protein [Nitrospirota bacterium]